MRYRAAAVPEDMSLPDEDLPVVSATGLEFDRIRVTVVILDVGGPMGVWLNAKL